MRIGLTPLAVAALLLGACEAEVSPEEQAREDAAAIAAVEAAQEIPAAPITPQAIAFADIEQNDLFGAGCAFSPNGGGDNPIMLASSQAGYFKLDGRMERLAPDMGSRELPLGARENYDGKRFSARLSMEAAAGTQSGVETMTYPAALVIRDARDQPVYSSKGSANCGA